MSSSNLVRLAYIAETIYGTTPASGDFQTARFTSESLSGTPQIAASEEIQASRKSAGQVQVGLDVGGDINTELSGDLAIKDFLRAGMMQSAWTAVVTFTGSLTVTAIGKTIAGVTNASSFSVGDLVILSNFTDVRNNGTAYITNIAGTTITVSKETIASETDASATITRPLRVQVGTTAQSFSIEKDFTDLTDKSISYRGMLVNSFALNFEYGSIANSVFSFMGNGYETPTIPMTDGRTILAAGTDQPLNASSDIGTVFVEGAPATFCIQNLNLTISNGMTPSVCLGELAPQNYSLGTAAVEISGSAYLADSDWSLMAKKISQAPVMIGYTAINDNGGIGVVVHGAQLSFPDPSSAGMDQQVSIAFTGSAKSVTSGYLDIYWI
jgi:hypothetical protein